MAEDSPKEESKDKLRFFKRAKGSSDKTEPEQADAKADADEATPKIPAEGETVTVATEAKVPVRHPSPPLSTILTPTLALAVRTLVILAIIVADAYAAYFLVVRGLAPRLAYGHVVRASMPQVPESEEPAEAVEAQSQEFEGSRVGMITAIEDIVVNPLGSGGTRYLCTTVAFESIDPQVSDEVTEREAQIRDIMIEILGGRTVEDLASLEDRETIREEIKVAVNDLLSSGEVIGVYFSNFVLQ
jgi:flagellar FliL protein